MFLAVIWEIIYIQTYREQYITGITKQDWTGVIRNGIHTSGFCKFWIMKAPN
jgi:hypothetical protein